MVQPASVAVKRESADGSAVALDAVTISFRFADGSAYTAVEQATLAVADGEFVSIVGPTGCGKTTLLNVAAGLLAPSAGRTTIFGAPLGSLNARAGYLFQAEALFPWKTAFENVAIGLEIAGVPAREARGRAENWLTRVGLQGFASRYPHMLSGGQRKRVGLAQVLIRDPKILLMDEPFGPLDAQTRQIMGNLLLDLQVLVAVLAIGLWPVLPAPTVLPPFFFSTPSDVFSRVVKWFAEGTIWRHLWVTLVESVLAFVIGSGAGALVGFWFARKPF